MAQAQAEARVAKAISASNDSSDCLSGLEEAADREHGATRCLPVELVRPAEAVDHLCDRPARDRVAPVVGELEVADDRAVLVRAARLSQVQAYKITTFARQDGTHRSLLRRWAGRPLAFFAAAARVLQLLPARCRSRRKVAVEIPTKSGSGVRNENGSRPGKNGSRPERLP